MTLDELIRILASTRTALNEKRLVVQAAAANARGMYDFSTFGFDRADENLRSAVYYLNDAITALNNIKDDNATG